MRKKLRVKYIPRDIDLRHFKTFRAIADCQRQTPSQAESNNLPDLNMRLDCQLYQRGRADYNLTEKGEQVYKAQSHTKQPQLFRNAHFHFEVGPVG